MIRANFTDEMMSVLSEMKGKTFKSYEMGRQGNGATAYHNLRINLGRFAVNLCCSETPMEGCDDLDDFPAPFSCSKSSLREPFIPYLPGPSIVYMVDEVIESVTVVTDQINVDSGRIQMSLDVALAIKTKWQTYTFAKDAWFSELIVVSRANRISGLHSIEESSGAWAINGSSHAHIDRSFQEL